MNVLDKKINGNFITFKVENNRAHLIGNEFECYDIIKSHKGEEYTYYWAKKQPKFGDRSKKDKEYKRKRYDELLKIREGLSFTDPKFTEIQSEINSIKL